MKFSCEKCGRTYAADEKVRGRSFKMKCKQCGHLIVVKPERAGTAAGSPAGPSAGLQSPTPPAIDLDSSSTDAFAAAPDPFATAADPFAAPAPSPAPASAPRPAFDPFAEPPAAAKSGGNGMQQPAPLLNESEEAFADLGREMASGTGGQPLATPPPRQQVMAPPQPRLDKTPRPAPVAPAPAAPVAAAPPRVPAAPAKGQVAKKSPVPLVLGAGAALAVAGVVGWFALGSGSSPAPARPAQRPSPVAAAPARPPAEKPAQPQAPVTPPAAAPQAATPAPQAPMAVAPLEPAPMPAPAAPPAREPQRAPAKKAPPPPKKVAKVPEPHKAAPRPEPKPQPAPPPPKVEPPKPEPRPAVAYKPTPQPASAAAVAHPSSQSAASASGSGELPALDEGRVEATFAKHRGSLDACVAQARQHEPGVNLDGRTVNVTMTVNPNGKALYPTLDDVELNGTELGNCLKRESGKIQFPAFGGDAIRVRKPIVLK